MSEVNMEFVLQAQSVSKRFQDGRLDVRVLEEVNLSLKRGESLAIVGASGSGKSTLLHILGGLDRASHGEVQLMGQSLSNLTASQLGMLRNTHLGFVYQFHHLLAELNAWENVAMPLWIRRESSQSSQLQAQQLLSQLGLSQRLTHRPSELSGGERQRVAIARALVTKPACVLADEPTGNLDRQTAKEVFELMLSMSKSIQTSFVVVTHDPELAALCDAVMNLKDGHLSVNSSGI
ncbi:MAG: lipoprotein-releasing ABC transporter ATP-binding protein LolD [Betaproteobacteria bacterium]|jgi:lipoprotein-releasing system ATP-binding protein